MKFLKKLLFWREGPMVRRMKPSDVMTEGNVKPTPEELTAERNLWQVFKASRTLPKSKISEWTKMVMVAALTAYVTGTEVAGDHGPQKVASAVRLLARDGLSFSSQVIGFVLASFTIFAMMNARSFTVELARQREPKSGHSYLKYVYLSFLRVFALYIGFIILCLAIRLLGEPNGAMTLFLDALPLAGVGRLKSIVARASFVALGSAFWFIVVELYGYIFNVYHAVMSGVRWDLERPTQETKNDD